MSVKYHLQHYGITLFFMVLSLFVHYIFSAFLLLYVIYFIRKTSLLEVIVFMGIVLFVYHLSLYDNSQFKEIIEGEVIDYDTNSCIIKCEGIKYKVYHSYNLKYGDKVKMKVSKLDINTQTNDNGFDEVIYFKANDIDYKAKCIELTDFNDVFNLIDFVESRLSHNDKVKSYQRLFLLGIKDENIENDYNVLLELSVIHLFALSGMHLNYLKKIIHFLLSFVFSKRISNYIGYIFMFLYLINIPYSISLYRAYFMMVLSDLFKDYLNQLDIYWLVFIVFLLINPYYVYNYSFIFSFGIYLFVIVTKDISYQELYIYLLSLPIVMYFQNKVYLISFLFSTLLGMFIEYFYSIILISVFLPVFNNILEIFISLLNNMIYFVNSFNIDLVFSRPNLSFFVFFYFISFLLIMRKQIHLNTAFYHCMLISLIIAFYVYGKYPLYTTVTMIDVGQGDCTFIRLPLNQGNILIDTGGNMNYDLATSVIIPYFHSIGVSSLDYVYISHDDYDHNGALESLCNHFDVKNVIDEFEERRKIGNLVVEMLSTDKQYSNSNDNSLIMKLSLCGYQFLFMGDASIKVETDFYNKYGKMDIDVLKVSHHGSDTSSGNQLFEMIRPKIAMIGVGKNNVYRHPSNEVIKRLERKGITILRTDKDGMFHLRFYGSYGYILR